LYLLLIITIIVSNFTLNGCNPSFDSGDFEVYPFDFDLLPTKQPDTKTNIKESAVNHPEYGLLERKKLITFRFKDELELQEIPVGEWSKIIIKFKVVPENESYDYADNNPNGPYKALIDGVESDILRPVGYLDIYQVNLSPNQSEVKVLYTASDISGVYNIVAEGYYWNGQEYELKFSKKSKCSVKIPGLIKVPQQESATIWYKDYYPPYETLNDNKVIWFISGQTPEHQSNNYLQMQVAYQFRYLAILHVTKVKENYNEWYILRGNDMSLPWGGMFWIGYRSSKYLAINRINSWGNSYVIEYLASTHYHVFAPPHDTHREGLNIDISTNYGDSWGNSLGIPVYDELLRLAAKTTGFKVTLETNPWHYHLKYTNSKNVVSYY
jgi:hypothetical protein